MRYIKSPNAFLVVESFQMDRERSIAVLSIFTRRKSPPESTFGIFLRRVASGAVERTELNSVKELIE